MAVKGEEQKRVLTFAGPRCSPWARGLRVCVHLRQRQSLHRRFTTTKQLDPRMQAGNWAEQYGQKSRWPVGRSEGSYCASSVRGGYSNWSECFLPASGKKKGYWAACAKDEAHICASAPNLDT
eukprot:4018580-Pleurochrysis_carterae.AAC.2